MRRLFPTFGILIFVALYIYASLIYPGGSPVDPNSIGYDWLNNLWCNLMRDKALNGQDNPARTISIFAIILLGCSMIVFFFQFTRYFVASKVWKNITTITGVLAMVSGGLIFTEYHDIMTSILSICGLIGILSIIRTLYINKMLFSMALGILCMIIIGLNNLFYFMAAYNDILPIVQLLDFILVLSWTVSLNIKMINRDPL